MPLICLKQKLSSDGGKVTFPITVCVSVSAPSSYRKHKLKLGFGWFHFFFLEVFNVSPERAILIFFFFFSIHVEDGEALLIEVSGVSHVSG